MKLVEDDARLRCIAGGRGSKRPPHVHHRELDGRGSSLAEVGKEEVQLGLLPPLATDPDRATTVEVAHGDAVLMPLAYRDLVHADGPRGGRAG